TTVTSITIMNCTSARTASAFHRRGSAMGATGDSSVAVSGSRGGIRTSPYELERVCDRTLRLRSPSGLIARPAYRPVVKGAEKMVLDLLNGRQVISAHASRKRDGRHEDQDPRHRARAVRGPGLRQHVDRDDRGETWDQQGCSL